MEVTLTTVIYHSDWSKTGELIQQNLAALDACRLSGELLILDNSITPTIQAQELATRDQRVRHIWNDGYNIYIGGALTRAIRQARGTNMVYFCAAHGLVNDPTWLSDMLAQLAIPEVGMAGCVLPCQFSAVAEKPADIIKPQIHVQGGLWAARLEVLRKTGFSHRFPFELCDVDISRRLLAEGYQLAKVPTISSIPIGVIPDPERYKYVHDYR